MDLDVCICTHNPRREVFARVLRALGQQTLSRTAFQVWIIDNDSTLELCRQDLSLLSEAGVRFTLVREPRRGNVYARAKAIQSSRSEWVVFVDDDNVLAPDYLARVLDIARANPRLGCFGGRLLLPGSVQPPPWTKPLLPYLAVKDCGDKPVTNCADRWGIWEPPTAGAAVRRPLLELYVERLRRFPQLERLGRKGRTGLFSCEDSLLMRGAYTLGLLSSYEPALRLEHYLGPERFRFRYLARLLYGLGRSHVILERALGHPVRPAPAREGWRLLRRIPLDRVKFCRRAYEWGYYLESRMMDQVSPNPPS